MGGGDTFHFFPNLFAAPPELEVPSTHAEDARENLDDGDVQVCVQGYDFLLREDFHCLAVVEKPVCGWEMSFHQGAESSPSDQTREKVCLNCTTEIKRKKKNFGVVIHVARNGTGEKMTRGETCQLIPAVGGERIMSLIDWQKETRKHFWTEEEKSLHCHPKWYPVPPCLVLVHSPELVVQKTWSFEQKTWGGRHSGQETLPYRKGRHISPSEGGSKGPNRVEPTPTPEERGMCTHINTHRRQQYTGWITHQVHSRKKRSTKQGMNAHKHPQSCNHHAAQ
mgnify:CR=1 FL=1